MDHLAFDGDRSIGLNYMKLMAQNYKASQTPISIVAVFHGAAGYMLLNDQAYNAARTSDKGNPFKEQILALQQEGVQFEECGQTARNKGWVNADLLPGVQALEFPCFFKGISFCQNAGALDACRFAPGRSGRTTAADLAHHLACSTV